jgi:hypothetical protein
LQGINQRNTVSRHLHISGKRVVTRTTGEGSTGI